MITLIPVREIDKKIGALEVEQRLKSLYTLDELIEKYEEEKPLILRGITAFKSKVKNINKYNFYFDFNRNSTFRVKQDTQLMKLEIISILITFERTREYITIYTQQLQNLN